MKIFKFHLVTSAKKNCDPPPQDIKQRLLLITQSSVFHLTANTASLKKKSQFVRRGKVAVCLHKHSNHVDIGCA